MGRKGCATMTKKATTRKEKGWCVYVRVAYVKKRVDAPQAV